MGRNVFISYKYGDNRVLALPEINGRKTRVRDYVNLLENRFMDIDELYWYGERDDESLIGMEKDAIRRELTDNIFPTSVTLVFISKGMKSAKPENQQWIPWEVSYSLKEISRRNRTSQVNGLLLVILPDEENKYDYFVNNGDCGVQLLSYKNLFQVLEENFHNKKSLELIHCDECGSTHYKKSDSFIVWVKWDVFIKNGNIEKYIEEAALRGEHEEDYNVVKEIS